MARYNSVAELIIQADDRPYRSKIRKLKDQARRDSEDIQKNLQRGLALGVIGGFFVKQSLDIEAALRNVAKTSTLTGDDLQRFGEQVRVMAQDTGVGAEALLEMASAAAALGVADDQLAGFTDAISKFQLASDFDTQGATFALSQLTNAAGESFDNIDNLASAYVTLGNNAGITESMISDSAISIAAAGRSYGITAQQALAFAASAGEAGLASFANGTAIGALLKEMGQATREGGDHLRAFSEVLGVSTEEVVRLFQEDAATAIQLYVEGLAKFGNEADVYLEKTGIMEARSQRLFKSLGTNARENLQLAADGYRNADAHQKEFESQMNSLRGSALRLVATLQVLATDIGDKLNPAVREGAEGLQEFVVGNRRPLAETVELIARMTAGYLALRSGIAAARLASAKFQMQMKANQGLVFAFKELNVTAGKVIGEAFNAGRSAAKAFINALAQSDAVFSMMYRGILNVETATKMSRNAFADLSWTAVSGTTLTTLKMAGLRTAINLGRIAVTALGVAFKVALGPILIFLPEIVRFLVRSVPDAIDLVGMKWDWLGQQIIKSLLYVQHFFVDFIADYMSSLAMLAKGINKLFGTNLSTTFDETWKQSSAAIQQAIDNVDYQQNRLERKMGESYGRIGRSASQAFDEIAESAKSMVGITDLALNSAKIPTRGDLYGTTGGSPMTAAEADAARSRVQAETTVVIPENAGTTTTSGVEIPNASRRSTMQGGPNPFNRITWEEHTNRVIAAAQAESEKERLDREEKAAEESKRIAQDRAEELARIAREQAARTQMEADELQRQEEMRQEHAMETELEVYRMRMEGIEEATIAHYERMRELELARKEALAADDQEELDRTLRNMDIIEKEKQERDRREIKDAAKQGAEALKIFGKNRKSLRDMAKAIEKGQALEELAIRGPSDAQKAYGAAAGAFPPPFGQVAGIAAAAAVIARYAATIRNISGMREGGIVGGPMTLSDSQLRLLQPGEAVIPDKKFSVVEDGIRAQVRREMSGDYAIPDAQEININIEGDEDLKHFLSVQADAADVLKA